MDTNNTIVQLFPSFEPALAQIISETGDIKTFKAGEMIMRTGQNIRYTVLIISGLVKVFREDDEGDEFFMYYLQPGQACALSMICATRQQTSQIMAKAVNDTAVIAIPLEYMDAWMTKYKTWYYFVLETYRSRFEELLLTVDHIAFRNMDERLVFYLRKHQETLKTNIMPIAFTEIAQELNSSREVISRLMKKLGDKGLIKLHKSHIEIINLNKLLS
jgi:CRP/FNR family transcriptional regulator, anaerobic regulatory protein